MTFSPIASLRTWLTTPLASDVQQSVDRLRHCDDVRHVALMPDVHLAKEVCVGAVVATERLVYPAAVGGDIGCGMAALAFDAAATVIDNAPRAAQVLAGLYEHVPANKHKKPRTLPAALTSTPLGNERLQRMAKRDGRVQLGTLGRGNHFLEFQADQDGRLWLMIHSGSRAVGQAILVHHLTSASSGEAGLKWLEADVALGQAYVADAQWARTYARENRLAMASRVAELLQDLLGITTDWNSLIECDHNHVQQELHQGKLMWIHRKGAQSADAGEPGIIPGSMGTASFHTTGRACADSLRSCSHGAGRRLSRSAARQQVSGRDFARQVKGLWYDHRGAARLKDEAPSAYRNIRAVMKAQKKLTRIVRELRPVLNYKGV